MKVKTILAFGLGPIGVAVLGILTTPLLAWMFSPEDVGRFGVLLTSLSLLLAVSTLGLDQAYVREYHTVSNRFSLFITSMAPSIPFLIALCILTIPFADYISELIFGLSNSVLTYLLMIAALLNYFCRMFSLTLRMGEKGLAYSLSQIIPKIVLIVAICVYWIVPGSKTILHLLIALNISMLTVLIFLIWENRSDARNYFKASLNLLDLKPLFKFGLPLLFAALAFQAISAVTIFSLRSLSTFSEVATYSITLRFASAAMLVQSIFSIVWAPIVYKWHSENKDMNRVGSITRSIVAIVCLFASMSGTFAWVADYLLPVDYSQVKFLLVCLMVQPLLYTLSIVTSVGLGLERRSSFSFYTSLIALIANFFLCLIMIPSLGAAGAVMANTISFSILFVLNTEASARVWRGFPRLKMYVSLIVVVGFSIVTVIFGELLSNKIWTLWFLLGLATVYIFKEEFRDIYSSVRKRL